MKLVPKYQSGKNIKPKFVMPNINPYGKDDARYYQKNLNDKASKIKEVLAHNKKYGYPITQGDFVRRHIPGEKTIGKTIKSTNQALEIVSPEFDALSLGTGFYRDIAKAASKAIVARTIGKSALNTKILPKGFGIPIKGGEYYRTVGQSAIDDAISNGVIRSKGGLYNGTVQYIRKNYPNEFKELSDAQLSRMDADDVISVLENKGYKVRNRFGDNPHIRNSTNHGGTVGFNKENIYGSYKLDPNYHKVIVGNENTAKFVKGHHGKYTRDIVNEDIPTNSPTVLMDKNGVHNASAPASDFSYYDFNPVTNSWENKQFYSVNKKVSPYRIEWDSGLQKPVYKEIPIDNYNGELVLKFPKVASLEKNKFKNTIFNSTTSDAANLSSKYVDDFPSGEYTFNPSLTNTAPIKADEKMKTFLESIPDEEKKNLIKSYYDNVKEASKNSADFLNNDVIWRQAKRDGTKLAPPTYTYENRLFTIKPLKPWQGGCFSLEGKINKLPSVHISNKFVNDEQRVATTLTHEFHHDDLVTYDSQTGEDILNYTPREKELLKNYEFTDDFKLNNSLNDTHQLAEKGASNRELRHAISFANSNAYREDLDKIIDDMHYIDLAKFLKHQNGYTENINEYLRSYYNDLQKLNDLQKFNEAVKNIKETLKYVPAVGGAAIGLNKLNNR